MPTGQLAKRVAALVAARNPSPTADDFRTIAGLQDLEAAGILTRDAAGVFAGQTPAAARIAEILNLAVARRAAKGQEKGSPL